jgi:hypothetical protein
MMTNKEETRFAAHLRRQLLVLISLVAMASAQFSVDVEGGAAITGYNDVRIPGDAGTLFSLSDDLTAETTPYYRLRFGYAFGERHNLAALFAPLQVKSTGSVDRDVDFREETFPANTPLYASYTFNSYRLTYRYDLIKRPDLTFGLGVTGKIRDAEIEVSTEPISSTETNVGFVPLINFHVRWQMLPQLGLLLDGDGLAGSRGRAVDALLALDYAISNDIALRAGYRILEGGADNDKTYNFALIHYAGLGIAYTFGG